MDQNIELKELRAEQEQISNSMSVLLYQSILIFGIPAIMAYFAGTYILQYVHIKAFAYLPPLVLACIFSVFVFTRMVKKYIVRITVIEKKIYDISRAVEPVELHD